MLEVKDPLKSRRTPRASPATGAKPASSATPAWPGSLYATPRAPVWGGPHNETFVAEDIIDGCRMAMQQIDLDNLTSIGVTSSIRGEGRTTIALATALVLAEYGLQVVLLELDFEHPDLAQRLGVTSSPGIGEVAEGRAALTDTMRSVVTGLTVIPAGQLHGPVPRALRELANGDALETLRSQGHVLVADLPPLMGSSVGRQATALMAEAILVVRSGVVPAATIKEAVDGLPAAPHVLLNGVRSKVPSWALRLSGI